MENAFLNIAKRDVKTAEIMFAVERYPEALFYLQQSAEKTFKYLALRTEISSEKKVVKYVGHNIRNFFFNVTQDFVYKYRPEEFKNFDKVEINKSINELRKTVESGKTDIIELIYMFNSEFLIKVIEGCKIKKTKRNDDLVKTLKVENESFENILAVFRLFFIGLFTFDHYENSRYPVKIKGGYNTPEAIYKKENSFIANLDLVIRNLRLSIESIEKGFEEGTFIRISEKKGKTK